MPASSPPRLGRDQRVRAAQLARSVAAEVDPGNALRIEEDLQDFIRDPDLVLRPPRPRDLARGFNLGDVDATLAGYALPLAVFAIQYLAGVAAEAVQVEVRPRLVALLRRPFHRPAPAPDPTPAAEPAALSAAQLDEVWQHVRENALALTKDDDTAKMLANAVRGGLERAG